MITITRLILLAFLILLPLRGDTTNETVANLEKKSTTVTAQVAAQKSVQVTVTLAPYHARFEGDSYQPDSFWGSLEKPPKTVIKNLTVKLNSADIIMLPSTFDYLGNPTKLTISAKGKSFFVKVFGGDAGAAYIATFKFTGQNLVEKRIDSAEFQGEIYEETQYVNNAADSDR
jgi:hypothetical protein